MGLWFKPRKLHSVTTSRRLVLGHASGTRRSIACKKSLGHKPSHRFVLVHTETPPYWSTTYGYLNKYGCSCCWKVMHQDYRKTTFTWNTINDAHRTHNDNSTLNINIRQHFYNKYVIFMNAITWSQTHLLSQLLSFDLYTTKWKCMLLFCSCEKVLCTVVLF